MVKIISNSGKSVEALIQPFKIEDFDIVINSGKFCELDWGDIKCFVSEVYKLCLGNRILGVIWFHYVPLYDKYEIRKIELDVDIWKRKEFFSVGGTLIAFAFLYSIKFGNGEVVLIPKTKIVEEVYRKRYNMIRVDDEWLKGYMLSNSTNTESVIRQYLPEHYKTLND